MQSVFIFYKMRYDLKNDSFYLPLITLFYLTKLLKHENKMKISIQGFKTV